MSKKIVLVTGATGKQGGAVVDALLRTPQASTFTIIALTRNTESSSAKRLAEKSSSVKLLSGDLDNPEAIFKNATEQVGKVWGVFSVQQAIGGGASPESEERQGKALVDAALAAGVQYFVYTSVDRGGKSSDDTATDIPHFRSKFQVEQYLREKTSNAAMTWTILRPVAFMEGLTPDFQGKVFAAAWKAIVKEKPLQLVATRDIGEMAAKAFVDPEAYSERRISLAGDELSFQQLNDIFKEQVGKDFPVTYSIFGHLLAWAVKDLGKMLYWFHDTGYGAEIANLRKEHPALMDFPTWLKKESPWKTA